MGALAAQAAGRGLFSPMAAKKESAPSNFGWRHNQKRLLWQMRRLAAGSGGIGAIIPRETCEFYTGSGPAPQVST
jgi:hypothetical protein